MSFQKAHNISNELAEVVVTVPAFNITTAQAAGELFVNQTFVADKNYRVLEVGFTAQTTTAIVGLGTTITVQLSSAGVGGADLITAQQIPALTGVDLVNGIAGQTVSTSGSDGAGGGWEFAAALLDTDGVPRLLAGQELEWVNAASAGTGWGKLFVRLAPETSYKD
tara:strand:+ start:23 stop:520 length:498 start_codon:yes stop_codon:yes gene_type:complete